MDLGLHDRVVLITGAGGGAGPTIARAFAAEGALVALHQRPTKERQTRAGSAAAGIVASGGRAMVVAADLTSADQVGAMIERVTGELGPVGVLVTATSAYRPERFADITDESWASIVDDLLGATFRACRAVVPGMQAAGWGRIVNIAARSGLVGVSRAAQYGAAKAAIIGLTASLAKELGPERNPGQRRRTNPAAYGEGRVAVDPRGPRGRAGQGHPAATGRLTRRPGLARGLARFGGEHVRDRRNGVAPRRRPALIPFPGGRRDLSAGRSRSPSRRR